MRVARGLEVILHADGVIIDGGPRRVMLRSPRSASLYRLVSLLDGSHSPESVCQQAGVTPGQLDRVIGTLRDEGVLESTPPGAPHGPVPGHVAAYLARAGRTTQDYGCAEESLAALAEAAVLLVAAPRWTRSMAADLAEACIGHLAVRASTAAVTEADLAAVTDARQAVIAVWDDQDDPAAFDAFMIRCAHRPAAILRFAAGAGHAEIGPLFLDGDTPCTACFRGRVSSDDASPDGADVGLAGSLAVTEILALAAQLTPPLTPGRMLRLDYRDLQITTFEVSPEPDCRSCGGPPDDAAALVETYEYSMAHVPARLAWSAHETPARRKLLSSLESQRSGYPWAPRRQLPAAGFPVAPPADGSPAARIGSLMQAVAGTRPDAVHPLEGFRSRWAPTGGNLASVELFAVTGSQLFGLPGNVVKYDDQEHAVVAVRRDAVPLPDLVAATDLAVEQAGLLLVLVAALGRLGQKYGEFCLRLAHLDAGCAALQLAVVAPELRLKAAFAASWTPAIAAALELDPEAELVTAIAGITIQDGDQWD